ncbi:Hypothetical predicted protein, partial [Pelobates cultripes]
MADAASFGGLCPAENMYLPYNPRGITHLNLLPGSLKLGVAQGECENSRENRFGEAQEAGCAGLHQKGVPIEPA